MSNSSRATQKLNVALAGLESALSIIGTFNEGREPITSPLEKAKLYVEEIREHLLTIQFHLNQL